MEQLWNSDVTQNKAILSQHRFLLAGPTRWALQPSHNEISTENLYWKLRNKFTLYTGKTYLQQSTVKYVQKNTGDISMVITV